MSWMDWTKAKWSYTLWVNFILVFILEFYFIDSIAVATGLYHIMWSEGELLSKHSSNEIPILEAEIS